MKAISVEQIEAILLAEGRAAGDYFVVNGAPMFWGRLGAYAYPMYHLIEDDALSRACVEYLRERGVKEFVNLTDVPQPSAEN